MQDRLLNVEKELVRVATAVEGMLEKHDEILTGNGKDGLVVKVDRLETSEKRRVWYGRATAGALLSLVGKLVYDIFGK